MVVRSVLMLLLLASCASYTGVSGRSDVAASVQQPLVDTAAIDRGGAFARARCASCHAVSGDGNSPLAAAPPLREIGRRYPVEQLGEAFAEGFVTTHPIMPEFVLDEAQNRDLIAYLKSIQTVE